MKGRGAATIQGGVSLKHRLFKIAGPVLAVGVLTLALKALHEQLHTYHYRDIVQHLSEQPLSRVLLAIGLVALSYTALSGYDWIALRYVGSSLPWRKLAPASFIATALSNNVGMTWLSGGSVRLRFYTSQGLSTAQVTQVVGYITLSFWVGFASVGGVLFLFDPPPIPAELHLPDVGLRVVGALFLGFVVLYSTLVSTRRQPLRIRGWQLSMPQRRHVMWQVLVAGGDWFPAAATLWVLMPPGSVSYRAVLGAFIVAQISGLASHVPGGLGVFETVVLLLLSDRVPKPVLLGTLLVYRALYYLLPFAVAVVLIGIYEVRQRRAHVLRLNSSAGRWTSALLPSVFALATFFAGVFLLGSSVTPSSLEGTRWVHRYLPVPLLEATHLVSGITGAGLLLLARGLQRRLDAAYGLTVALLTAGIASALLRGLDVWTALVLTGLLVCFVPCHGEFYRRDSLVREPFTAGWGLAVVSALAATAWLGLFVHHHDDLSNLLWRFVLHGEGPRFLHVCVSAAVVVVLFAGAHLLRPPARPSERPSEADLATARDIVARSPSAWAHLALQGDKSLLFNEARTAFLMYAHQGRSWVALGEPVGPEEELPELVWRFRGEAERHDGLPVFYGVGTEHEPLFLDMGLSAQKLGEEARVPLEGWRADGPPPGQAPEGCRFEVVAAEDVEPLLPELKRVSDAWLARQGHAEQGFSAGYFDERSLTYGPVALVWRGDRVVAFASLWTSATREEFVAGLSRLSPEAPPGVMTWMLERVLEWGRQEGYRWFSLGLAPSEDAELSEHFEELPMPRSELERFHPRWVPRYLASPADRSLPFVLEDVAALISRGPSGRGGDA